MFQRLVSLAGNALAMSLLVEALHLRVMAANGVGIVGCSLVNYCLGDLFVFAAEAG